MKLGNLITENQIIKISVDDRKLALDEMIKAAHHQNKVANFEEFRKAILERETIISTGIGLGVALPHAKIDSVNEFFIMIGICETPINWDSLDGEPVQLVFMIGGPNNDQRAYLQLLAKLMLIVKNEDRRNKMINAENMQDVVNLFREL